MNRRKRMWLLLLLAGGRPTDNSTMFMTHDQYFTLPSWVRHRCWLATSRNYHSRGLYVRIYL